MGTLVSSSAISLDILTRLYDVATNSPHSPLRSKPTYLLRLNPPTVFIHPKIDSTRFRTFRLDLYASWRVVRPSIADHLFLRATCGMVEFPALGHEVSAVIAPVGAHAQSVCV